MTCHIDPSIKCDFIRAEACTQCQVRRDHDGAIIQTVKVSAGNCRSYQDNSPAGLSGPCGHEEFITVTFKHDGETVTEIIEVRGHENHDCNAVLTDWYGYAFECSECGAPGKIHDTEIIEYIIDNELIEEEQDA